MGADHLCDDRSDNQQPTASRQSLGLDEATSSAIERARQLAAELVEQRGHSRPPFLPAEYAPLVGIRRIEKADLGTISAILLRMHDGYVIRVNNKHNPARRNFSCAHEIGHALVSDLGIDPYIEDVLFRTFNPQAHHIARAKARERLCDAVATELIMPETVFSKYMSGFDVSIRSAEQLANAFRVSIISAALRIAEISIEPCITLLWRPRPRTNPTSLQLAWCIGPGKTSQSTGRYVPKHRLARPASTLYRAYRCGDSVKCWRLFRLGTGVQRIPMESKAFGAGDMRYVISLAFPAR